MLRMAVLFFVIALIAGVLGLFRTEYIASEVAWVLFVVFLVIAVLALLLGRHGASSLKLEGSFCSVGQFNWRFTYELGPNQR